MKNGISNANESMKEIAPKIKEEIKKSTEDAKKSLENFSGI